MPRRAETSRRRRTGIAAVTLGLAAGLLAGLTGCSSAGSGSASAHPAASDGRAVPAGWPDAIPGSGLAKGLVLPLEAYMETYPESVAIDKGVQRLETQCMARYGFTFAPPPPGSVPPPNNDDSNMIRRYGLMDRAHAAKLGYALGDEGATPPPSPKLSAAATAVLTGRVSNSPGAAKAPSTYQGKQVPDGGCIAESADKVGARFDTGLPSKLDYDSLEKSQADPRVQGVIRAWSACMKSKGYTVDTPLDAAKLAPPTAGLAVSAADITVATTDVDCKSSTGLVKVWFGVETAIQQQQVETNQLALQQVRSRITAAVKAASAIAG